MGGDDSRLSCRREPPPMGAKLGRRRVYVVGLHHRLALTPDAARTFMSRGRLGLGERSAKLLV